MAKFIRLNEVITESERIEVLINTDNIQEIQIFDEDGAHSLITLSDRKVAVDETLNEIKDLLGDDLVNPEDNDE